MSYPERLIEVDLPIRRIPTHARREKSLRHGNDDADDSAEGGAKNATTTGFVLQHDTARATAQGPDARLENLGSLVEVSCEQARPLFGKDAAERRTDLAAPREKHEPQLDMFKVPDESDGGASSFRDSKVERHGKTVLDRIHQSMILFAAGRGEALKRFVVEDGVGRDQRPWRPAQALWPGHTEEQRRADSVLACRKALGF